MKKERIMVDGIEYKYIITENNTLRFDGIVPYKTYRIIKEILIKQEFGGLEDWKAHIDYLIPFLHQLPTYQINSAYSKLDYLYD